MKVQYSRAQRPFHTPKLLFYVLSPPSEKNDNRCKTCALQQFHPRTKCIDPNHQGIRLKNRDFACDPIHYTFTTIATIDSQIFSRFWMIALSEIVTHFKTIVSSHWSYFHTYFHLLETATESASHCSGQTVHKVSREEKGMLAHLEADIR